jgi:hypothetical protein
MGTKNTRDRRCAALPAVAGAALLLTACAGAPPYGAWEITDVALAAGSGFADPPECTDVVGVAEVVGYPALLRWDGGDRPIQPAGGDWWEESSPYTGYLLNQTGADAYRCAYAKVTVERNPDVAPEREWGVGNFVQLWVVAPHFCGDGGTPHPGEDRRQPLVYAQMITQQDQTEVVFPRVIVASACGIGPYPENYGEGHLINFGQWPSSTISSPLQEMVPVGALDCTFIVGYDNFQGCP